MAPRRRRGETGEDAVEETDAPKNRPPNTAFRQQRMRAWQCVLTPKLIVTIFSILAAIYLGFGAWLTYLAHTVCSSLCSGRRVPSTPSWIHVASFHSPAALRRPP